MPPDYHAATMEAHSQGPLQTFMRALAQAFPQRPDVQGARFDGTVEQAWEAWTQRLGLSDDQLAQALAPHYGVPAAGPLNAKIDPTVLNLLPLNFCQQHKVVPLALNEGVVTIASATPDNAEVAERTRFLISRKVRWVLAPPQAIDDAVVLSFNAEAQRAAEEDLKGKLDGVEDNTFVRLTRSLMSAAVNQRASDLHIQPFVGAYAVRIRVDGRLKRLTMLREAVATTLIRHVKTRSGTDPTNQLIPQDGRMSLVIEGREFDLRVSTLPAGRGDRLVIRFLDQGRVHRLNGAGFSLAALQALRRSLARPSGMVIMTGPTGCGKTSTLYGMLAEINRSTVNIITVENPVEYRLAGISQVEVNDKAGLSFNSALRSILRQDPDVVLIGEIRDSETAQIATQAALTGHLVLSTLHTNDAVTAIPRLLNLGVDPSVLADSLVAIAAQRLCRKLCAQCKTPASAPLQPAETQFMAVTRNAPAYRPVGCKACDFTGFMGRLPIVDILEMNKGLREAVASGESRLDVLTQLRVGGLQSLAVSGSHRIIAGETTVQEVMETVGPSFWPELAAHHGAELQQQALDLQVQEIAAGQAVLLASRGGTLQPALEQAVQELGLHLLVCNSAQAADEMLRKNEDIAFIVGEVPDGIAPEQLKAELQAFRTLIAWARLPTLVVLPAALAHQEEALRLSGSMADFVSRPVDTRQLVEHIRRSHAR
jgi:type II secretory ATPase GspE/PulE/Tfp pilus assembly ATPase PilB-like protein